MFPIGATQFRGIGGVWAGVARLYTSNSPKLVIFLILVATMLSCPYIYVKSYGLLALESPIIAVPPDLIILPISTGKNVLIPIPIEISHRNTGIFLILKA